MYDANNFSADEDLMKELVEYAKQGFEFKVVDSTDFKFGQCKCKFSNV
jgi:hypothetical protein